MPLGADARVQRGFAVGDLGRCIEQVDVLLQCAQGKADGNPDADQQADDEQQAFLALRIHWLFSRRKRRASSCK